MIKNILLFIIITLFSSPAYANLCGRIDRTDIEFHYNLPEPNIINVMNFEQISTINNRPLTNGYKQTGLTKSIGDYSLKTSFKYIEQNNYYCIFVDKIDIYIGYQYIDVYIPNQYKPGSCEYNEVLKHEIEHVDILTKGIYNNKLNIENNLYNTISSFNMPIVTKDLEKTKILMNETITNNYKYLISNLNMRIQNENDSIDTSSNYSNIARKCRNW